MESFEEQEEQWLALPLGEVLAWLDKRTELLWERSVKAGGDRKIKAAEDYEKVESLRGSVARVVAWLASMQPPQASKDASQSVPVVGKQRARGRVCVACRRQVRRTTDLVTLAPIHLPGLPVHKKCFIEMEEEFGGKQ